MGQSLDRRTLLGLGLSAASAATLIDAFGSSAKAQAGVINWKCVANTRLSSQFTVKWKWLEEELAKRTNGRLKLDTVSFPELGMTGAELIRVLNAGILDAGEVVTGYVSGEVPIIEGAQMVGVYKDIPEAQRAYEAWLPKVVEPLSNKVGGKPISSFGFTSQFLWSKLPINSLADLKGKKIRIFAKAQSDYLTALGATTASIPLAELYSALQRGVVDGCITGPEVAAGAKYHEVVGHVTDLLMGPGAGFLVVSNKAWNGLPPDIKKEVEAIIPRLRELSWELTTKDDKEHLATVSKDGIKMQIPPKPEWVPQLKKIAQDVVVPNWVKRAGPGAAEAFNEAIAPIVGFKAHA
jgi:TRAP-type C4-dicarboxylate transport system substrate-binding protein